MKTILTFVLAFAALPLFAAEWRPLWDGRTLDGWHITGMGDWKIVGDAIRGTHVKAEKEFSHLVSDRVYTNFAVRLKFKTIRGNSGFYFRIEEKGYSGVSGFQAEISPDGDTGGLYETNGRSWVSQPKPADVKKWHHVGEWTDMTIRANGGDITVTVNGQTSAALKGDPGRAFGRFALRVHADQDVEVWFKDIEIQEE
jgi:hypothetical protein